LICPVFAPFNLRGSRFIANFAFIVLKGISLANVQD